MRRNDVVKAMFSIWKYSHNQEKKSPQIHSYYYGMRVAITTLANKIDIRNDLDSLIDKHLHEDDAV